MAAILVSDTENKKTASPMSKLMKMSGRELCFVYKNIPSVVFQ